MLLAGKGSRTRGLTAPSLLVIIIIIAIIIIVIIIIIILMAGKRLDARYVLSVSVDTKTKVRTLPACSE